MKQFSGYDEAKKNAQYQGAMKLPKGAYVAEILKVDFMEGKDGNSDMLEVKFEIVEGEYAGFFKKQYEENTSEDKKYKGRTTVYIPKDDGSERDGWTKNSFARWTNALEESNSGYTWDWDESKWKGKKIGLVFGEVGTVIDGKDIVYTAVSFPVSVETVRSGKAPVAKFRVKNGYKSNKESNNAGATDFMNVPDGIEEELPF